MTGFFMTMTSFFMVMGTLGFGLLVLYSLALVFNEHVEFFREHLWAAIIAIVCGYMGASMFLVGFVMSAIIWGVGG